MGTMHPALEKNKVIDWMKFELGDEEVWFSEN